MAAVGMVDVTDSLKTEIAKYKAEIQKAEKLIEQIPAERYRQILTYRYLCGWSLKSISDELGYKDQNSIYRAHGWALAEAQKILNKQA